MKGSRELPFFLFFESSYNFSKKNYFFYSILDKKREREGEEGTQKKKRGNFG